MCDYVKDLDRYATEGATGQYPVSRPIKMRSKEEEQAGVEARQAGKQYTGTEEEWRGTKERETGWQQGQEQGQQLPPITSAQTKMGYETRPTAPTTAAVTVPTTTVPVTTPVTVPVPTPVTMPLAAEQAEAPPEEVTGPMGGRE